MKKIEVEIKIVDIMKAKYPDMMVAQKLREAGIPLRGAFTPQGVEHGTLIHTPMQDSESVLYIWAEDRGVEK